MSQSQLLASAAVSQPKRPAQYRFLEHNRQVRQKIETWQTRSRRHDLGDLDQALFQFYSRHIENVSSVHELNRLLREKASPDFLCVNEVDLVSGQDLSYDDQAFPDAVPLESHSVPLAYAYSPGEEHDGVTVKLDLHLAEAVSPASVEWAVPGLREAQTTELLRALPKALRRQLMPLAPKVAEITSDLRPHGLSLKHDLARFIRQRYGVEIPPGAWPADALPQHLRPRVEVIGPDQKPLAASRDLGQLRQQFQKAKVAPSGDPPAWTRLAQRWERFGLTGWTFGDLPEKIPLDGPATAAEATTGSRRSAQTGASDQHGTSRAPQSEWAWPGLAVEEDQVNLRLFRTRSAARQASRAGVRRLAELVLQKDLAWLQKDLRGLCALEPLLAGVTSVEQLQNAAFEHLKNHLLPDEPFPVLSEANFHAAVEQARRRMPGLALQLGDRLDGILKLRQEILRRFGPPPPPVASLSRTLSDFKQLGAKPVAAVAKPNLVVSELEFLLPDRFLETIPFGRLADFPRYLKALLTRAERAALNPAKDQERARQLAPYRAALAQLLAAPPAALAARRELETLRWMVEEFKVSLFAQELGTTVPVSPRRLEQQIERIRAAQD